jgi:hypothetical protein
MTTADFRPVAGARIDMASLLYQRCRWPRDLATCSFGSWPRRGLGRVMGITTGVRRGRGTEPTPASCGGESPVGPVEPGQRCDHVVPSARGSPERLVDSALRAVAVERRTLWVPKRRSPDHSRACRRRARCLRCLRCDSSGRAHPSHDGSPRSDRAADAAPHGWQGRRTGHGSWPPSRRAPALAHLDVPTKTVEACCREEHPGWP